MPGTTGLEDRHQGQPAGWSELATVLAILAALVAACVLTAKWFPAPFLDEVMYTDPSVNLHLGRGFVSSTWPAQSRTEFWAGNSPLHEMLLYVWIQAFGFSVTVVRAFGAVLLAAAIAVCWLACVRLGLIRRAAFRIVCVTLLATAAGTTYVGHYGRPDGITILLTALSLLAWSIPESSRRLGVLVGLALLFPVAGVQLVAYAAILCVLLWLFVGRRFFPTAAAIGVACATGFALLVGFYAMRGVAGTFLTSTVASGHALSGDLAQMVVIHDDKVRSRVSGRVSALAGAWRTYTIEPSFLPLLATGLVTLGIAAARGAARARSVATFGIAAGLLVGPLMLVAGKYPFYYSWMAALPLVIGVSRASEDLWMASRNATLVLVTAAGAFVAAIVGLPSMIWSAPVERRHDLDRIEAFVQHTVRPEDGVYGRPSAYYAVKARAVEFYQDQYAISRRFGAIPDDQKHEITVILTSPDQFPAAAAKCGGEWVPTGEVLQLARPALPDPASINALLATTRQVDSLNVDLHVYRRKS